MQHSITQVISYETTNQSWSNDVLTKLGESNQTYSDLLISILNSWEDQERNIRDVFQDKSLTIRKNNNLCWPREKLIKQDPEDQIQKELQLEIQGLDEILDQELEILYQNNTNEIIELLKIIMHSKNEEYKQNGQNIITSLELMSENSQKKDLDLFSYSQSTK